MDISTILSIIDDDDDIEAFNVIINNFERVRSPSILRYRWDCQYLLDLSSEEGLFITEYCMNSASFDVLHQLLQPYLEVDNVKAGNAMNKTGSLPISTASRLGQALILLGGGRSTEVMRTHGVSMSQSYLNFHRVVKAINLYLSRSHSV